MLHIEKMVMGLIGLYSSMSFVHAKSDPLSSLDDQKTQTPSPTLYIHKITDSDTEEEKSGITTASSRTGTSSSTTTTSSTTGTSSSTTTTSSTTSSVASKAGSGIEAGMKTLPEANQICVDEECSSCNLQMAEILKGFVKGMCLIKSI